MYSYDAYLAQEVENFETILTCNGTPKMLDDEYNCEYCECEECEHWKEYNK